MSQRFLWVLAALLLLSASSAPAQTLVVANKTDGTVDLLDPASGMSRATLPTGAGPHEVAVSPDGRTAVVSNYGHRGKPGSSLTVIDLDRRAVTRTIELGRHERPHGMAWLSSNRIAVTAEGSGHLLLVDVADARVVSEVATGQEISHMVAVTPDGTRAFVANIGSGSITAIDLVAGAKLGDIATGKGAEGIALTPDGRHVWVTNRAADTLSVVDAATLEILYTLDCPGFPIRVAITPDGRRALVSCAKTGEVVLFDVDARRELRRARLDLKAVADAAKRLFGDRFGESPVPVGLVVAADGKTAWVAATQSDVVVVVDVESLVVRELLQAGREPDGMALSRRGA